MKKIFKWIAKNLRLSNQNQSMTYFTQARDWHYDRYNAAWVRGNRWQFAFLAQLVCTILALFTLMLLLPLKTLVPLVIHQNVMTGEVWVTQHNNSYTPPNDAQVQADLVRYITARETYSSIDLNQRYHQVRIMSNSITANQYEASLSKQNLKSPVNILGNTGLRTVHIEDIVFIDKEGSDVSSRRFDKILSSNLVKVDFTTTTTVSNQSPVVQHWVATISWSYRGLPKSQQDAWDNWSGFTVNYYRVDARNI